LRWVRWRLPLVGKIKFFFFHMADVPEHIMDARDKAERLKNASKMGAEGKVTAEGGFF